MNPLKDNFYFPFIAALKPPKDCRQLDAEGRTFVCKKCHKQLRIEWEEFEKNNVSQEGRSYVLKLSAAIIEDLDISSVCFLCGITVNASFHFKLYSYPHSGKGVSDGGPFFPFLSSREPALNAQPIDNEGTAVACEIGTQNWNFGQHGRDVVLCDGCQKEVQRDLEAMDDSNAVSVMLPWEPDNQDKHENLRESEIKGRKSKLTSQGRAIVIDSSEESEEGDGTSSQPRNKQVKLNTDSQSSNASPMHYTTSLSPGLQPVLHNKDSTPVSTDSSMSGGQASFAAALRKLAKQAKPVPSSTSSPLHPIAALSRFHRVSLQSVERAQRIMRFDKMAMFESCGKWD
ncbi:hypothetical protein OS493_033541 [Desmophyllum pertusum]|uniref:Uncharacterized protein n=1 Tax=Desmophyllum pertusum TaxID=174260 RepID=A0A9W9ZAS3_9CNID|nr:hypothetical protein OS493_033541 [Desmophyllum pertusum]